MSKEYNEKSHYDFELRLIQEVIKKLNNYISTMGGTKISFLAFDGVAPVAKMDQQKTRRYKSCYEKKYKEIESVWETSAITPGTLFMKKLERALREVYDKNKNIHLAFSDPGEGEHKIFDYIRNHGVLSGNTIIYGLDSDLIMLSLQNSDYCEQLFLYREMPEFIESLDNSLKPNEMYMINIELFKTYLAFYLNNEKTPVNKNDEMCRIRDYIFICFLLGNDFLPHFPCINLRRNGIDFVMESYVYAVSNCRSYIINNDVINWKVFRKMIIEMAKHEHSYLKDEYDTKNKQSKRYFPQNTQEEKDTWFSHQPLIYREKECYIDPESMCWQGRYYYALFDLENEDQIKNICMNYLEGMEWTYKYYSKGCVNWRWHYKYNYPPLLEDLQKHIPYFNESLIENQKFNPVNSVVQLCYVLPYDNKLWNNILHDQVRKQLEEIYKKYSDVSEPEFEWAFCKYFWESHVVFKNYPSIDDIEKNLELQI
jgi:5'-3' exonuclease